jgi:hypothetical protein
MRNEFRGEQPPFNELHKAYQIARVVDQALELGLPVFPCRNTPGNEKTDKTPLTPNGFKDASADPNEIRKMFSQHPGCLIGVPSAAASGIDILDVDPRHGGNVWYAAHKGKLPPTRIHRTRRGGLHRLFRHMPGLRNTTAKIAPGIDTRCDGGYFIWWPATGLEFQDYPPAGLPEWPLWLLPSMMSKPVPRPPPYRRAPLSVTAQARGIAGIVALVANAKPGERNALVFWGGCRFAEMVSAGVLGQAYAENLLSRAGRSTGLPDKEIAATVRSAWARSRR